MSRTTQKRVGVAVLPIALGVAALAIAAFVYWVVRNPGPGLPSIELGQQTAETFLNAVRSGNHGAAWDSTTAEYKSLEGRESFIRSARKRALYKQPLQFVSSQEVEVMGQPRRELLYQDAKTGASVRILVANEAGEWRVDRLLL